MLLSSYLVYESCSIHSTKMLYCILFVFFLKTDQIEQLGPWFQCSSCSLRYLAALHFLQLLRQTACANSGLQTQVEGICLLFYLWTHQIGSRIMISKSTILIFLVMSMGKLNSMELSNLNLMKSLMPRLKHLGKFLQDCGINIFHV